MPYIGDFIKSNIVLQVEYDELEGKIESIGKKLRQRELDESELKYEILGLAESMKSIMIKRDQKNLVNCIYSIIMRKFKSKFSISMETERMVDGFFKDFPEYRRDIIRNNARFILSEKELNNSYDLDEIMRTDGIMPEENIVYMHTLKQSLDTIDKVDFSKLTKDQASDILEKIDKISKDNKTESKSTGNHQPASITNPSNKLTQILIKIRNQFDEIVSLSQYANIPTRELEDELFAYFNNFYRNLRFVTDKKHKITLPDWSNLSLATNDINAHHASSHTKFLTSLCANCKDIDEDKDPEGKKHIYQHVQMYHEYNIKRTKKNPLPYVYRCPRCKGKERLEVIISRERVNEYIAYVNALFIDTINHNDILKGLNMFLEELIKPSRLNSSHETSNKLLSVR
jgi:hypothetical protein